MFHRLEFVGNIAIDMTNPEIEPRPHVAEHERQRLNPRIVLHFFLNGFLLQYCSVELIMILQSLQITNKFSDFASHSLYFFSSEYCVRCLLNVNFNYLKEQIKVSLISWALFSSSLQF